MHQWPPSSLLRKTQATLGEILSNLRQKTSGGLNEIEPKRSDNAGTYHSQDMILGLWGLNQKLRNSANVTLLGYNFTASGDGKSQVCVFCDICLVTLGCIVSWSCGSCNLVAEFMWTGNFSWTKWVISHGYFLANSLRHFCPWEFLFLGDFLNFMDTF